MSRRHLRHMACGWASIGMVRIKQSGAASALRAAGEPRVCTRRDLFHRWARLRSRSVHTMNIGASCLLGAWDAGGAVGIAKGAAVV